MKNIISIVIFISVLVLAACENSSTSKTSDTSNTSSKSTQEGVGANDSYLQQGKHIAATTFITLSGNLQKAMQEGGVSKAVKYCNINAFPLVDSLSQVHKANIRRTSLKIRNPKDKPSPKELEQLLAYEKQAQAGEKLKPVVVEIDPQTIAFYAPIHMMPLCEKCHGKLGSTLTQEDYEVIQQFYPNDEAIGYKSGDLRGMWSLSLKK